MDYFSFIGSLGLEGGSNVGSWHEQKTWCSHLEFARPVVLCCSVLSQTCPLPSQLVWESENFLKGGGAPAHTAGASLSSLSSPPE